MYKLLICDPRGNVDIEGYDTAEDLLHAYNKYLTENPHNLNYSVQMVKKIVLKVVEV